MFSIKTLTEFAGRQTVPTLTYGCFFLVMSRTSLERSYRAVVDDISTFCTKNHLPVPNLVAVSKYKSANDIKALYDLGHRHFGENYVQELLEKSKMLPADIQWHFIGNLQSNKCKIAREIPNLAFIETLDSESKATKLNSFREETGFGTLYVYIQVNTSGENQKSGLSEFAEIEQLAHHVRKNCPNLVLKGLMTIGSLAESKSSTVNHDFSKLASIRQQLASSLNVPEQSLGLSMGMSNDYHEAIRQGSTNVRVGSLIFGARAAKESTQIT